MVTKTLIIMLLGIVVGVALGTTFSRAYPTIKIEFGFALVFAVYGLSIVLAGDILWRALWRAIKQDKT